MSHAPTTLQAPEVPGAVPRAKAVYGILSAAVVAAVIASLLTATVMSGSPTAAEAHGTPVAPAASMAAATASATSVPDAGSVFNGKNIPAEEPAPTF